MCVSVREIVCRYGLLSVIRKTVWECSEGLCFVCMQAEAVYILNLSHGSSHIDKLDVDMLNRAMLFKCSLYPCATRSLFTLPLYDQIFNGHSVRPYLECLLYNSYATGCFNGHATPVL